MERTLRSPLAFHRRSTTAAESGTTPAPARRLFGGVLVLSLAIVLAFLLLPIVAIFARIPPGELFAQLGSGAAVDALVVTLKTNLVAQAIILLFGTPAAYFVATRRFRGRRFVITLIELPLVLAAGRRRHRSAGRVRPLRSSRRHARGVRRHASGSRRRPSSSLSSTSRAPSTSARRSRRSSRSTRIWSPPRGPSAPARPARSAGSPCRWPRAGSAPAPRSHSPAGSASSAPRSSSPAASRA